MTDYSAIADHAVEIIGSADETQYEAAYAVMVTEAVLQPVDGPVYESELGVMSRLGVMLADQILGKIEAAVPARVQRLIQSERGINLNDPQTSGLVDGLVAAGVLTSEERDALMAPVEPQTVPRWPGLLPGHVQNALQWRSAGRV